MNDNYSNETRKWLKSVIAQRRLILKQGRNRKDHLHVEKALNTLYQSLCSYGYTNPVHMARFVLQRRDDILTILPGYGSTNYRMRLAQYFDVVKKASDIINPVKIIEYEIAF